MRAFEFLRPKTVEAAVHALRGRGHVALKAGGTDLLERMKERLDEPQVVVGLVDVGGEPRAIGVAGDRVRIGALATLEEIAASDLLPESLREAAAGAASLQIRGRATLGGNLAQHTRCGYYRLRSFPCLRHGDDSCPALAEGGVQETAGIFANRPCASAHPSSIAPVLGTLRAVLGVRSPEGERDLAFADLWDVPRKGKASDTTLRPADVIAEVEVDGPGLARGAAFEEIRPKAAFDWALVSAAVRLRKDGERVAEASVWLGAVAPTPHRAGKAEEVLRGKPFSAELAAAAADAAVLGATPLPGNAHKVHLAKVAVRRALERAWGRS